MASASDVKAVIDHGFADIETVLQAVGKADLVAELEKAKALVENPLVLEIFSIAITAGLAKLGLGLAAEQPKAS